MARLVPNLLPQQPKPPSHDLQTPHTPTTCQIMHLPFSFHQVLQQHHFLAPTLNRPTHSIARTCRFSFIKHQTTTITIIIIIRTVIIHISADLGHASNSLPRSRLALVVAGLALVVEGGDGVAVAVIDESGEAGDALGISYKSALFRLQRMNGQIHFDPTTSPSFFPLLFLFLSSFCSWRRVRTSSHACIRNLTTISLSPPLPAHSATAPTHHHHSNHNSRTSRSDLPPSLRP